MPSFEDLADEDPVVAGFDGLDQTADHVRHDVDVKDRAAIVVGPAPDQGVELVRDLGGHAPGQLLSAGGEDVGREASCVLDRGQSVGGLVDACQGERRVERHGAEGAHGQTARPVVLAESGEHHHPARQAGHDIAKFLGPDHRPDDTGRH
jgi:hypothetical protein